MGWDGSGNFTRTNGDNTGSTTWASDKADGDKIVASRHDTHDQDLADGINACLAKNGENAMTGNFKTAKGSDVASANALGLGTDGNYFDITGTTAITSIDTIAVGTVVTLHFDGALTLTHHATDLILPGGANITTAAGDEAMFVEYATGDWRCINYQAAADNPAFVTGTLATEQATTSGTAINFTGIPSGVKKIIITLDAVSTDGSDDFIIQIGDSGGLETTGYSGRALSIAAGGTITSASTGVGFIIENPTSLQNTTGHVILTLADSANNTWIQSHNLVQAATGLSGAGMKSLSATLDRLTLTTTSGTDNFDNGAINILYE